MTPKVLPMKFQGWKFSGRPVDHESVENYIPWNLYVYSIGLYVVKLGTLACM